jgi:hypothetical protein
VAACEWEERGVNGRIRREKKKMNIKENKIGRGKKEKKRQRELWTIYYTAVKKLFWQIFF